jgi:hypothetical protein
MVLTPGPINGYTPSVVATTKIVVKKESVRFHLRAFDEEDGRLSSSSLAKFRSHSGRRRHIGATRYEKDKINMAAQDGIWPKMPLQ